MRFWKNVFEKKADVIKQHGEEYWTIQYIYFKVILTPCIILIGSSYCVQYISWWTYKNIKLIHEILHSIVFLYYKTLVHTMYIWSVLKIRYLKVIRKFFLNHNKSFRWHLGDYEKRCNYTSLLHTCFS